ncbi:ribose-5-phosphate isomerase [Candidatus Curtissbacteria bacterium RIFCSPHIGHO2_01_FULL_41_11]|uniref:Ribose-5-phosphate isomerase n=1 Tax=Candidatus Curtissbacteria bacterium RIFCSPHIGHO2_01_FULL_41_11 TaxID=1797711 RepID=A0A1F5G6C2_9BACT|nr:MAG: ribose-5-phosphate isomerase [Candidatus Curtissbacteria bacterium RIFCSPHIGHO2_01_FULL_41_11]
MKIYIASDHAGFYLKKELIKYLGIKGYDVEDVGAFEMDEEDDYPDFIIPCVKKVVDDTESLGIVIGGSGNGEAIAANKIKGIRAAVYNSGKADIAKAAKEHNDANVLSLGARFITSDEAKRAVTTWLEAEFQGDRHQRRLDKISKLED